MAESHTVVASHVEIGDGLSVYVERVTREPSRRARPSVLFVNGAMATTRSYRWAVDMLGELDLIFYDPPSVGRSARRPGSQPGVSLDLEVHALKRLNEVFRPDYLISVSWGGIAAIHLLAGQPSNLKKAAIGSLADRLTPAMVECIDAVRAHLDAGRVDEAIAVFGRTLGRTLDRIAQRAHVRYFQSRSRDPREVEYVRVLCDRVTDLEVERLREMARRVACECLLINGALDEYTPASAAEGLARLIPNSRRLVVGGVGHFLAIESEAAYRVLQRELSAFFDASPGRPLVESCG